MTVDILHKRVDTLLFGCRQVCRRHDRVGIGAEGCRQRFIDDGKRMAFQKDGRKWRLAGGDIEHLPG
ncbi:hypothetical protein D3C80_698880 [compost metagenome]